MKLLIFSFTFFIGSAITTKCVVDVNQLSERDNYEQVK